MPASGRGRRAAGALGALSLLAVDRTLQLRGADELHLEQHLAEALPLAAGGRVVLTRERALDLRRRERAILDEVLADGLQEIACALDRALASRLGAYAM
jgi:hypothetical protein